MRFPPVTLPARAGHRQPFLDAPAYREVQPVLVAELRRARRYEHPLGVAMLGLECPLRPAAGRAAGGRVAPPRGDLAGELTPTVYSLLGSFLRNTLRETDILAAAPEALAFAVFLPGTDLQGAERALRRYRDGFAECVGCETRGGVAAFPGDGLTLEDLFDRASQPWRADARDARVTADAARPARSYARG